jgi:predicted dehydrogenase
MKVGLLGCGSVAWWIHRRALAGIRGVTLAAAADPDPDARARFARVSGVELCEGADELLGRGDIEAVLICAPTHLHATLALAAAAAGKPFYLEKPIATTLDDARCVVAAAGSGLPAVTGFNRRHHPLFEQARALLADGAIGRVHAVQTSFCEAAAPGGMPAWKRRRATGGGVLLDLASHHIDAVRWMLATEVRVVSATIASQVTEHDEARLTLETDTGATAQCFFSFVTGPAEWLQFIGDRGNLRLDRHTARLTLSRPRTRGYGAIEAPALPTAAVLRWRAERTWRPAADPSYRRALIAFIEEVRGGAPRSATLTDGLRSLEAVVAAEDGTCASS